MEILIKSFNDALAYVPDKKTYGIRIEGGEGFPYSFYPLKESKNWIQIQTYCFDDIWPKEWKEYAWVDLNDSYFGGILNEPWEKISQIYPLMTKQSLMSFIESKGQNFDRGIFFDKDIAAKIINDFKISGKEAECVLVHCEKGQNRSPAIGIALNEIFNWGIEGLKEQYFDYRKYVYSIMMSTWKERSNK
jgi:hypothetical protein